MLENAAVIAVLSFAALLGAHFTYGRFMARRIFQLHPTRPTPAHSLEDGIVKRFLRAAKAAGTMQELTKRPLTAEGAERAANPRSRSAKMRVAERTDA